MRWAGELDEVDFSDDEMDVADVELSVATGAGEDRVCEGNCLDRVEGMVKMLVALGGLASPTARLEVEKCKGRMARE